MSIKKPVKKSPAKKSTKDTKSKLPYVIVRCSQAGVHAGYLVSDKGGRIVLKDARRIWYWDGAASISEIAVYGCNPTKQANCRFAAKVAKLVLFERDACELVFATDVGRKMIEGQAEWRA